MSTTGQLASVTDAISMFADRSLPSTVWINEPTTIRSLFLSADVQKVIDVLIYSDLTTAAWLSADTETQTSLPVKCCFPRLAPPSPTWLREGPSTAPIGQMDGMIHDWVADRRLKVRYLPRTYGPVILLWFTSWIWKRERQNINRLEKWTREKWQRF